MVLQKLSQAIKKKTKLKLNSISNPFKDIATATGSRRQYSKRRPSTDIYIPNILLY